MGLYLWTLLKFRYVFAWLIGFWSLWFGDTLILGFNQTILFKYLVGELGCYKECTDFPTSESESSDVQVASGTITTDPSAEEYQVQGTLWRCGVRYTKHVVLWLSLYIFEREVISIFSLKSFF